MHFSSIISYVRERRVFVLLLLIIFFTVLIRLYHLSDWLHFEGDQARDALVIKKAIEGGPSFLPLLGPRAGGTTLRLGPFYYYMQYLSAKLFNSLDPVVFVYPDLIVSILAVPLFYFLLRFYFNDFLSLIVVFLYSVSFISVIYSRHAWNPNGIPFWTILFLYALLRFTKAEKNSNKLFWIIICALSFSVASQLHFLALFSLPIVGIIYLFWSKGYQKISYRFVFIGLLMILLMYLPAILNEIKTHGSNFAQFTKALESKPSYLAFWQKILDLLKDNADYYFFFLTTFIYSKSGSWFFLSGAFVVFSLLIILFFYRIEKHNENKNRLNFLKMVLSWFVTSFLLLFPFAGEVRLRYFFSFYPIAFIFLAFVLKFIYFKIREKKIAAALVILLVTVLTFFHAEALWAGTKGFLKDRDPKVLFTREIIVGEIDHVPLSQIKTAAAYLINRQQKEGKILYIRGNMAVRAPFQYLFRISKIPVNFKLMSRYSDDPEALYFYITSKKNGCSDSVSNALIGSVLFKEHKFGHRFFLCELKLPVGFKKSRPLEKNKIFSENEKEDDDFILSDDPLENARQRDYWKDVLK